ncbi:MAG: hypothetical protein KF851_03480 [Pirellulaceae bacterium]|nr:hypothetical protein [Pirellulaceae bacterium]
MKIEANLGFFVEQDTREETDEEIKERSLLFILDWFDTERVQHPPDRKFDCQTMHQRKSSNHGIGVSGDGQPIGSSVEGIWQIAAAKIGADLITCAGLPHAGPESGILEARQEGVDVDVGQFLRLVGFGGCIE